MRYKPVHSLALAASIFLTSSCSNLVVLNGEIAPTTLGTDRNLQVDGTAQVESSSNTTVVRVEVSNLQPLNNYMSHVHNLTCDQGGGGHYKHEKSIKKTYYENELWMNISTDGNGYGSGVDEKLFVLRDDAKSIVIHDADGGRIACGDLLP